MVWSIDPLDGTKEFIKRNGHIGLIKNNEYVLGVVVVPCQNKTYYAIKGQGAFLKENNNIKKINCRPFNKNNVTIVCSLSHINKQTLEFIDNYSNAEIIRMGSSLKMLIIAEGKADIYPRLGPTMEWDTCASQIIVEEAGGWLTDHVTGEKMMYNKESLLNNYFIIIN